MTPIEEKVTVNGTRLRVRIDGRADAPVIVLLNSLATDFSMWDANVPALSADYRVLRFDARGHGKSDAPAGPYSMDVLVDDVAGLLAHFRVTRAHLAGVSLGGLVCLAAALRKLPQVASIAVCDSRADMPPEFVKGIEDRNALVREKGIGAIAQAMAERWLTKASLASRPDLIEKIKSMVLGTSVEGFTACAEAIKTAGLSARISAIRLPALFVVGDQDAALPVALMKAMQAQVLDAQFAEIKDAGHLSNLEQPEAFNQALLGFLAQQT